MVPFDSRLTASGERGYWNRRTSSGRKSRQCTDWEIGGERRGGEGVRGGTGTGALAQAARVASAQTGGGGREEKGGRGDEGERGGGVRG